MQNQAFPANGNAPEPTTRQPDTWAAEKSHEKTRLRAKSDRNHKKYHL